MILLSSVDLMLGRLAWRALVVQNHNRVQTVYSLKIGQTWTCATAVLTPPFSLGSSHILSIAGAPLL